MVGQDGGMSSDEAAGNSLAYCRKDMNLRHPVGECPYDRDPVIAVYDMVLPSPPDPREAAEWRAWRSAGGNLVTEAGRQVPWPSMTVIVTRTCGTCCRNRPGPDFELKVNETLTQTVDVCRDCRVKLWDDPDDAGEINRAMLG
jgi:hypothetical protein